MTKVNASAAAAVLSGEASTGADRADTAPVSAESASAETTAAQQTNTARPDVIVPERVFRMGAIELPDPDRTLDPLEALRLHALNYPHLATATLSEPQLDGERLVYEVEKPPVKTKG